MAQVPDTGLNSAECGTLAETSDYGLEGFLAPFDPVTIQAKTDSKAKAKSWGILHAELVLPSLVLGSSF